MCVYIYIYIYIWYVYKLHAYARRLPERSDHGPAGRLSIICVIIVTSIIMSIISSMIIIIVMIMIMTIIISSIILVAGATALETTPSQLALGHLAATF